MVQDRSFEAHRERKIKVSVGNEKKVDPKINFLRMPGSRLCLLNNPTNQI